RRWRRRREAGAHEHQDRLVDKNQFVWRRWRDTKVIEREIRRRFVRRGEHRQSPPRIPDVRSVRIPAQIRPVGRRRIGHHAAAPDDLLAADSEHRGDARRVWTIRIDREELLIAVDAVAIERRRVGIIDARKIAQGFVANVGERHDIWRRWRIDGAFGHEEWAVDLGDVPGDFGALAEITDAWAK